MRSAKDILYGKRSARELLGRQSESYTVPDELNMSSPVQQPDVTGVSPMAQMGLTRQPEMLSAGAARGVAQVMGAPEPITAPWWGPMPPVARNVARGIANLVAGLVPQAVDAVTQPVEIGKQMGQMVGEQAQTVYDLAGRPTMVGNVPIPTDPLAIKEGIQKVGQDPLGIPMTALMLTGAIKGLAGLRSPALAEAPKVAAEIPKETPVEKPAPVMSPSQTEAVKIQERIDAAKPTTPEPAPTEVNKFQNVNTEHIPADLQVEVDAIGAKSGKLTKIKDTAVNALKEVDDRIGQYKALWECLKA